jgi:hypothetical protein
MMRLNADRLRRSKVLSRTVVYENLVFLHGAVSSDVTNYRT